MEIKFQAHAALGGKEFVCNRCSEVVERMPGKQNSDEQPYVMYCPKCDSVCGEWLTKQEREQFLAELVVHGN